MKQERNPSALETPGAVSVAAELAEIDTAEMAQDEINAAVTKAGKQIYSNQEATLPANYRRVKFPPFASPLALSVAAILVESLKE